MKTKLIKFSALFVSSVIMLLMLGQFQALAQQPPTFTPGETGTPPGNPQASYCPGNTNDVRGILNFFTCLITNSFIPLLITMAIMFFIYGVVQYMINANDSTKREEGRNFMIWGLIALFVIVSIWGLVRLLASTFGFNFVIPQLQQ